ncbi:MAG TPA: SIMPL domain-containing protein, partial [Solirubrobacteraceae bacterium]|nr:SIMPL domain-containing protein [Solirubrobacteraceae bacterium]
AGHGEAQMRPDRAALQISVQTRASSAAQAAAENARRQQAVLDTLRRLGLAPEQLSTAGYDVSPVTQFDKETNEPRVVGYAVTNTIRAEVRNISQVGRVIDASLAAGANMMNSLQLYASSSDSARRAALAIAMAAAHADAEVLARSAGGRLGRLLSAVQGPSGSPPIIMRSAMAAQRVAAPTPISEGELTVGADVSATWEFIPNGSD